METQTPQQEIAYLTAKVDGIVLGLNAFTTAHDKMKAETEAALKEVQTKISEIQGRLPK